ncbi:hypothetical protein OEZ71_11805 [Defluviimonas sp. WL0050]|uniref:Uncharacterized protein n=1 Tax=Albidovulum litorale TaxID=2984134 RepID=A0ABT2ZPB9_9RHOB|nr:hypothetical protein [Defluviimonas sp. WL0050]MCV2872979.1 hypothetical protein [Defluviimonas sp. WL0050]
MDAQRLINTIVNIVTRRLINLGINKGIDTVARKGKPKNKMTAEDRKQAQDARALAKRARQAAKITRRLGR